MNWKLGEFSQKNLKHYLLNFKLFFLLNFNGEKSINVDNTPHYFCFSPALPFILKNEIAQLLLFENIANFYLK